MTPEQFTYWLQGFFELSPSGPLSEMQAQIIRDHLALVMKKVTPDRGQVSMKEVLEENPLFVDKSKICFLTC